MVCLYQRFILCSTFVIGVLVGGIPAPSGYSPRASPVHSSTLTKPPHTVKSMLAKIDHSRSLRQLVLDAKKVSCSLNCVICLCMCVVTLLVGSLV